MALLFMEGFDGALSVAQLQKKWGRFGTATLQASGRNGGGNALWSFSTTAEVGVNSTSTSIVGIAVNPLSPLTGVINLIEWGDPASSVQCRLRINVNGTVEVLRSGTVSLGTSVATVITDAYTYLECKLFVHNTLGTVEVRLDNVTVLMLSGVDTQGSGTSPNIQSVDFRGNTGAGVRVDDLYIADDSGSVNNDFFGNCRVDTLSPISDDIAEFDTATPSVNHFENVDEMPVDEDTSYNETATTAASFLLWTGESLQDPKDGKTYLLPSGLLAAGAPILERDVFGRSALPVHPLPSVVLGVQPWSYIKKQNDSGDVQVRHLVQPVATIYNQTLQGVSAESWTVMMGEKEILETNPETAAQWLESEVNATNFGMEVV